MHYSEVRDLTLKFWSVRDGIQWHTWALPPDDPEHPINQIVSLGKNPLDYYDAATVGEHAARLRDYTR
jgi:hypothetical protein